MYKLKNSLIALVGMHCKKTIPTFLITLAIVVMMTSPMGKATASGSPASSKVLDTEPRVDQHPVVDDARSFN